MLRRNFPFLPGLASTSLPTLNLDFIRLPPHAHIESTRHLQNGIVDDFGVHPPRTNSVDNQSNKSGWVGLDPVLPKLAGVFTSPVPKWYCQMRLIITRAVSGWLGWVSHLASARRRPLVSVVQTGLTILYGSKPF